MIKWRSIWLQIRRHSYISMCIFLIGIGLFYLACASLITVIPLYQKQIAQEFSQILNEKVKFSDIKFTWRGLRLYARVYNVDVGNPESNIHIDNINKVQFLLHPVKSLLSLSTQIDNITINGGTIYLNSANSKDSNKEIIPDLKQFSDISPELINNQIAKIFKNRYLNWFNINKVNLKNTKILMNDDELLVSHLDFHNSKYNNYLHGMLYQVNNKNIKNKGREKLEFAIKLDKRNNHKNLNTQNRFYLATNSQGIDLLLNKILKINHGSYIKKVDLDQRTWLKVWGNINLDESNQEVKNKLVDNLQFAIHAPEVNFYPANMGNGSKNVKIRNLSGNFAFNNEIFNNTLDNFTVHFQNLKFNYLNNDFKIDGNINKENNSKPVTINSIIRFGHTDITKFFKNIPKGIINDNTLTWLQNNVTSGWLGKTEILWRGNIDGSIPYDKKNGKTSGVLRLKADLRNTDIDYKKGVWPKVSALDGVLYINGRDLIIESSSADISASRIKKITARINSLGTNKMSDLILNGSISSNAEDLHKIIATTPLKKNLSGVNKSVKFSGDMHLDLNLNVPLDNSNRHTTVSGQLNFDNNSFNVLNTPFKFEYLNGSIKFTDKLVKSELLQASFNNRKALISINNADNGNGTEVTLNSWLDMTYLGRYLNLDLNNIVSGASEFDLKLNIDNDSKLNIVAESLLIGVESYLPEPYYKNKQNILPVKLVINDDIKTSETSYVLKINQNNKISQIKLDKKDSNYLYNFHTEILSGELLFDKGENKYITNLDFIKLNNFIKNNTKSNTKSKKASFNSLDLFGLPSIEGKVNNLYIDGVLFGSLEHNFDSIKDKKLFKINSIKLKNDFLDLDFSGIYSKNNESKTSLNGSYKLKDVSKLASIIGEDKVADKIKLTGKFNLNWPDELFSPTLDTINGKVIINTGFGRITDIEPGMGRIFSFFNLDSLNKRLRLDFSDVFEEGYKFDNIAGVFTIENSIINTNRVYIEAGSADVDLYGHVDLKNKIYNLGADVTPHITSSLPIAAAVIGTPVAGAAVFLIDKILESPFEQLTERAYSIQGSWSKPVVKQLKHKRGPLIELSWFNPMIDIEEDKTRS